MHATRRLLTSTGYAASRGFNIPPRGTWDILSSAGNACISLFDQKSRDDFVATLNKGIINPPVLGQADFGFAMILALYNDLNSPLFQRYKFDAEEFASGAKPALERFHDVYLTLEKDYLEAQRHFNDQQSENDTSNENESPGSDEQNTIHIDNSSSITSSSSSVELTEEIAKIMNDKNMANIPLKHPNWIKEANDNPDSLEGQLYSMVTTQYFDTIQLEATRNFFLQKNYAYESGSGEIQDIALLSARALEVIPPGKEENTGNEKNKDKEVQQEWSDSSFDDGIEQEFPVVAQIEVLYSITQKLDKVITSSDQTDEESSYTKHSVSVGVFEGWLNGDPDGNESLRWKLVLNRPAWEFPELRHVY